MMTPAPDTGRTAEEIKPEIVAALNAAFRGFSFSGGRWSAGYGAEMAAEALLAGPLAPVLAEIAQLRSRLLQAEKGGEAMRAELSRRPPEYSPTLSCPKCGIERGWFPACAQDGCPLLLPETQEAGDHEQR